jgi:hypothetical protein
LGREDKTATREHILRTFAGWTALSALRSGSLIKSRADIARVMSPELFTPLEDASRGPISPEEFDAWHEQTSRTLVSCEKRLGFGWAVKLINVYLKTYVYIGGAGRPGLASVIHPPIDGMLWRGIRRCFGDVPAIVKQANCVERINQITDYACYRRIIEGCGEAARALGCTLFEVEQLWSWDAASADATGRCRKKVLRSS